MDFVSGFDVFHIIALLFVVSFSFVFAFVVNKGFEGGGPLGAAGLTPFLYKWGGFFATDPVTGEEVAKEPNFAGKVLAEGCDFCTGFWGGLAASVLALIFTGGGLAVGNVLILFLFWVFGGALLHYLLIQVLVDDYVEEEMV